MIKIVTDTDSNLPQDIVDKYNIPMAPIAVTIGDQTWIERFEISDSEFYQRMIASPILPRTSQPSVGDFEKVYRQVAAENPGAAILSIHISSTLSGTLESARQAAGLLPELDIRLFDTRSCSIGQALQVAEAARMAHAGASYEEIAARLEDMRDKMQAYFMVDTLEYLAKGGRIGKAAHLVGTLLDMKPILTLRNGVVEAYARHRTRKRALAALDELVTKGAQGKKGLHLGIVHAVCEADARRLADSWREKLQPEVLLFAELGPGIGVHTGPGTIGVCWYSPEG